MDKKGLRTTMIKMMKFVFGLFVFAAGTVCILNAAIGVGPWDVFHQGVSKQTGITVGQASIYLGLIILVLDIYLGQPIGWGTIGNMILIGTFVDLIMLSGLIPRPEKFFNSLILLSVGLLLHGLGVYLYISVGWGAGPRDGLMVILVKKTGKSVRLIKSIQEIFAVSIGYLLGGNLGIGTLIVAFLSGPIWQFIFKLFKFDVNEVEHRAIQNDIKFIRDKYFKTEDAG